MEPDTTSRLEYTEPSSDHGKARQGQIIHTLPLLIRPGSREADLAMALDALHSLSASRDHHIVIYNQGVLSPDELDTLVSRSGVSADILGDGRNAGIAAARKACFDYIGRHYPQVPYLSEIHVDMLFPPDWYDPLIDCLASTDEPLICPGILTSGGELQPLGRHTSVPPASEDLLRLLPRLSMDELRPGFVHPVVHRADILREIGGYDTRFLQGKQGFEDDSLLLGYAYYMGTRLRWRPKCCLRSWVYHATLAQRMSLEDKAHDFLLNETGIIRQYGAYGLKQLSMIHGEQSGFMTLFDIQISSLSN